MRLLKLYKTRIAPPAILNLFAATILCTAVPFKQAHAFIVKIQPGTKSLYLQVGAGTISGGTYSAGGTPANNGTINTVTVTVPAASLGAGSRPMLTDSTVIASNYNGRAFCNIPSQVYVGGFHRDAGPPATANLTVTAPTALVNVSGDLIPFNTISWISGGIGDATPTIPSGTFAGGTPQMLLAVDRNDWFESCLQFNYANSRLVPAGTFTGQVRYTLSLP